MACLAPIWNTKRETARRVRQRISRIMLWCIAQGYRQDNPAGDAVAAALPRGGGGPRNRQRALPYSRLPDALGRIRSPLAVEGAYFRKDLIEQRCRLMQQWQPTLATSTAPSCRFKVRLRYCVTVDLKLLPFSNFRQNGRHWPGRGGDTPAALIGRR